MLKDIKFNNLTRKHIQYISELKWVEIGSLHLEGAEF